MRQEPPSGVPQISSPGMELTEQVIKVNVKMPFVFLCQPLMSNQCHHSFEINIYYFVFIVCVCMCAFGHLCSQSHVSAIAHIWRTEDIMSEYVLSFTMWILGFEFSLPGLAVPLLAQTLQCPHHEQARQGDFFLSSGTHSRSHCTQ